MNKRKIITSIFLTISILTSISAYILSNIFDLNNLFIEALEVLLLIIIMYSICFKLSKKNINNALLIIISTIMLTILAITYNKFSLYNIISISYIASSIFMLITYIKENILKIINLIIIPFSMINIIICINSIFNKFILTLELNSHYLYMFYPTFILINYIIIIYIILNSNINNNLLIYDNYYHKFNHLFIK